MQALAACRRASRAAWRCAHPLSTDYVCGARMALVHFQSQCTAASSKSRLEQLREQLREGGPADLGSERQRPAPEKFSGLAGVKHVIAVTSCKGGVGKSTVAVNLAAALKTAGHSVGLLDADVYGPSLPALVSPADTRLLKTDTGAIRPLDYEGIKCMSYGWSRHGKAAVLRGPLVSGLITQLATNTDWGDLDVLLIDMPPGTGDIHITVGQNVQLSSAVVVTTPQRLSLIDVAKGIEVLSTFGVPTVSLVENMLYFNCEHGTRYEIFGPSIADHLTSQYGIPSAFGLPIEPEVAASATAGGMPLALLPPERQTPATRRVVQVYDDLAKAVLEETARVGVAADDLPVASFDPMAGFALREGDRMGTIAAKALRLECLCAECVDEVTRTVLVNPDQVSPTIEVVGIAPRGNYAVEVRWSDGHASLYSYRLLWDCISAQRDQ